MQWRRCDSWFPPERGVILPEGAADWKGRKCKLTITTARLSANGFGHEDVMAGNLNGHVRGERSGAGFEVAEVAVEGRKRRAGADDAEVDSDAARLAEEILRSIH